MTDSFAALASFLDTLPVTPRLLALGEPNHGDDAFPAQRNRLFRALVEVHGFRSIALESDILAGQRVNAYVTGSADDLDEVLRAGFSHDFGRHPANRELVAWLRDLNAGRAPADQVRFYGFDPPMENLWAASPRASLLALHAFLAQHLGRVPTDAATIERLCGEDARWTDPAAGLDAAQSIGNSGEARELRLLADDLVHLLATEMPGLVEQPGFWDAQLAARTAAGLLRYHAVMADPAPDRVARMLAARDLMMAGHLCAIAGREQSRGPTLVFAHNLHLQRGPSAMQMGPMHLEWWGAGAHVSRRLGERYAFIASYPRTTHPGAAGETVLLPAPELSEGAATRLSGGDDGQPFSFPLKLSDLPLLDGVLFVDRSAE